MSNESVLDRIKNSKHSKVKIAVTDVDGVLRGKYIHRDKFFQTIDSGLGFCDVIFGWDVSDEAYPSGAVTGWHTGYPDAQLKLDLNTYRTIPWEDDVPFLLGDFSDEQGTIRDVCPRTLVKRIQDECLEMGFLPLFTQEFEWFNFQETPDSFDLKAGQRPTPITPGMFGYSILRPSVYPEYFDDIFRYLEMFRVPAEGMHTETGPGVYEACTMPETILEAADQATLFKTSVKQIAYRHRILATFMAKWNAGLPGCSGHVHQSLWDNDRKKNLFFDRKDTSGMSTLLKSYLAGQLKCLPYILPMYAPTVNSYKRLVEGAWAPTTVTWGVDNRTTAFRVLSPNEKLTRIETRIPGADVNPYLAMAASLASGLYGIKNELSLEQEGVRGNGYDVKQHGILAPDLKEATRLMKSHDIANELFGEAFVRHFTYSREWEWQRFSAEVTDYELKRYFEII